MTAMSVAHKIGNARMHKALGTHERTTTMLTTSTLYRVHGHAGLWYYDGPAIVVTDGDTFEHPDLVLVHQAADPANVLVIEPHLVVEHATVKAATA